MRYVIVALALLALAPPRCLAQTERRSFSFAPLPPDRCEYFFITEAGINALAVEVPHGHLGDQFLYTDSFGFMKNMGRFALGASIDVHLTRATSEEVQLEAAPS